MTYTPPSQPSELDVLIVGSGPVGSTYARTIGDALPGATILIVEVGPKIPGVPGNHTQNMSEEERKAAQLLTQGPDRGVTRSTALADIAEGIDPSFEFRQTVLPGLFFVDPKPRLNDGEVGLPAASMSSGVGGMGIHWGGSTPRPHGSERPGFIPGEDLDAALDHAEVLLGVSKYQHESGTLLGDLRDAIADLFDGDGFTPVGFMPHASQRSATGATFSGPSTILGDIADRVPGFEIRADTLARRILVENGEAVGAELEDRMSGEVYQVRAKRVVVAADGLRTPQLLFASDIRPPALGHYLNEHFQMATFLMLNDEFDPSRYPDTGKFGTGNVLVPFSDARPVQGGIAPLAGSGFRIPTMEDMDTSRLAILAWYGSKDLQFRDAVEFSETEKDSYGMPAMSIRYSRTEKDDQTVALLLENSLKTAERIGTVLDQPTLAVGGSSLHYQGTVRMGPVDDGTSVCDSYSRVWGVKHLFVGGNGVIATSTAANPTLTSVALAYRAATALVADLEAELVR